MKKDKRAITSRENGKFGGRPRTMPEPLSAQLSGKLTPSQAAHVAERGGWKYIRALIDRDKRNPAEE